MKSRKQKMQNKLFYQKPGTPETLCYRLRKHLGKTQYEFGELVGVNGETIGTIERGGNPSNLTQRSLDALAEESGMEVTG